MLHVRVAEFGLWRWEIPSSWFLVLTTSCSNGLPCGVFSAETEARMDWVFHSMFLYFSVDLVVDKKLIHLLVLSTAGVFFQLVRFLCQWNGWARTFLHVFMNIVDFAIRWSSFTWVVKPRRRCWILTKCCTGVVQQGLISITSLYSKGSWS